MTREELAPLLAFQQPSGPWPAVGDRAADVSFWACALAVNTLMTLGATQQTVGASLDALVHCRPREASWLARLRFWLSDRQVRFDPRKYGWPWVARHGELGAAHIDGADHSGMREEKTVDPRH